MPTRAALRAHDLTPLPWGHSARRPVTLNSWRWQTEGGSFAAALQGPCGAALGWVAGKVPPWSAVAAATALPHGRRGGVATPQASSSGDLEGIRWDRTLAGRFQVNGAGSPNTVLLAQTFRSACWFLRHAESQT